MYQTKTRIRRAITEVLLIISAMATFFLIGYFACLAFQDFCA